MTILLSKMAASLMMKSSLENVLPFYPFSVAIQAQDRFIEDKLAQIFPRQPAVNGGADMLRLDGEQVTLDGPILNLFASGDDVTHLIEAGFSIHVADGLAAHDWSVSAHAAEDCVRLRFVMTGDAQYRGGRASMVAEDSSCAIMIQPAGAVLTGHFRRNQTYRHCSVDVSRSFLITRLGVPAERLPSSMTTSWERREIAFGRIALERSTRALFRQLFTLRADDAWTRIEAQAIALQIIARLLSTWRDQPKNSAILVRLRPSERAALIKLRGEIDQDATQVISIAEAQRRCGLNRNKIHYGFKEMFGTSLHRYCTDLRLQRAADLLRTTDLTIAEVAEQIGFSEATNFTAAFRQRFGCLPSADRKGVRKTD